MRNGARQHLRTMRLRDAFFIPRMVVCSGIGALGWLDREVRR
jgi:hypothetical protein